MKLVALLLVLISCAAARSPQAFGAGDRTVKVPLTLQKGSNSLYANLYIGNPPQLITPTVYTDTFQITITSSTFKSSSSYNCNASVANCMLGPSTNVTQVTIPFSLLPGVNDRIFLGNTYLDVVCPKGDNQTC